MWQVESRFVGEALSAKEEDKVLIPASISGIRWNLKKQEITLY